jgi:hypothetical protein
MSDLFADVDEPSRHAHTRVVPWIRRVILAVFALFIVAVLAGAAGQQPARSSAAGPRARLVLLAPDVVRGGLLVQVRFEIHAITAIKQPRLVLERGYFEGMQVSSIEPSPPQEAGHGTDVALGLPAMPAGADRTVWMALQVAPTTVGDRPADVTLQDGPKTLAHISHRITILP